MLHLISNIFCFTHVVWRIIIENNALNGPHVDAVETISRIAKTLQQFLGLGIKGSNYLINEILYWSNSIDGKLREDTILFKNVSEASKYLRNCERTCKYIKDLYA